MSPLHRMDIGHHHTLMRMRRDHLVRMDNGVIIFVIGQRTFTPHATAQFLFAGDFTFKLKVSYYTIYYGFLPNSTLYSVTENWVYQLLDDYLGRLHLLVCQFHIADYLSRNSSDGLDDGHLLFDFLYYAALENRGSRPNQHSRRRLLGVLRWLLVLAVLHRSKWVVGIYSHRHNSDEIVYLQWLAIFMATRKCLKAMVIHSVQITMPFRCDNVFVSS